MFTFCTSYDRDNPFDENGVSWSPPAKPEVPVISSATPGDGSVTVSWNTVSGATSYNLYYRAGTTVTNSNGTKITDVTSPYSITGLTNGTQYSFALCSVNSTGESNLSSISTTKPVATPTVPAAPAISSATPGDGSVKVSWSSVSNATSYNLYYREGSTVDKSNGTKITGVTSPHTITTLSNGKQYAFAVNAVNSVGEGSLSTVATATPSATPTVPAAPTISSATPGDGSVTVSWNTVNSATSYNLYYLEGSTVDKSNGTKIAGITSLSRTVTSLSNGTPYAFALCAVNIVGESDISIAKTATPKAASNLWVVTDSSLTDPDGNIYTTVKIGNQVWTVDNLKTTKYNDGISIPNVTDNEYWSGLGTGAYCYYGNDIANKEKFGALYNWAAVNTGKLSPYGWRVPTDADWTALENYLIANGYNYDGTTTGNKIAKSMAAGDWKTETYKGTVGNDLGTNNKSGFSGLPGGFRLPRDGGFTSQGESAFWWCATKSGGGYAYSRSLNYHYSHLITQSDLGSCGYSVRLVRD